MYREINIQDSTKVYAYLHATRVDNIKGSSHACDKLDDLVEAFIANTPGTIDEEDQVSFGTFADCVAGTMMLFSAISQFLSKQLDTDIKALLTI